ncbi:MAG: spore germination protein [Clostridia bacterium]|nr:spore germination protein [Clostridia bacterium]
MLNYQEVYDQIKNEFCNTCDLRAIELQISGKNACFFFIDGYIDTLLFENNLLKPLKAVQNVDKVTLEVLNANTMFTTSIEEIPDVNKAISEIASGEILLLADGSESFFKYSEKKYQLRAVTEPPVSTVLRGPREGFVEDLKTNMFMIRRRVASSKLTVEMLSVGKYTQTKVALCFIDGIADGEIVGRIKSKIQEINIDGVIESSYVARYLEENKFSLFSQVGASEKPDTIVGKMLEGRVAIIVDGSPSVLTLPFMLYENFQMSEDYYIKSYRASMVRIIRLFSVIFSILMPGIYVALQEHQYQLFPIKFLVSILGPISNIPLSPTLEMLLVLCIFEILNETSIRMPRYVSMALSVVGAIILGEAAVTAGLFSISSVIIVAVSTVGIYCVPDEINSSNILRLGFVAIGGVLGLGGILFGAMALIGYMCSINSYGVSYMSPFAPSIMHDWQDGPLKAQIEEFGERPYSVPTANRTRQRSQLANNDKQEDSQNQKGE